MKQARERRFQVKVACASCKIKRAACDDKRPCSRCVHLGIADTCVDAPRKKHESNTEKSGIDAYSSTFQLQTLFPVEQNSCEFVVQPLEEPCEFVNLKTSTISLNNDLHSSNSGNVQGFPNRQNNTTNPNIYPDCFTSQPQQQASTPIDCDDLQVAQYQSTPNQMIELTHPSASSHSVNPSCPPPDQQIPSSHLQRSSSPIPPPDHQIPSSYLQHSSTPFPIHESNLSSSGFDDLDIADFGDQTFFISPLDTFDDLGVDQSRNNFKSQSGLGGVLQFSGLFDTNNQSNNIYFL